MARRFVVTGRVQGVGYRAFVRRAAVRLELAGIVRNQPDGSVEVIAAGAEHALDDLATALLAGPPLGRVTGVDRSEISVEPDMPMPFEIR